MKSCIGFDAHSATMNQSGLGIYTRHLKEALLAEGSDQFEFDFYLSSSRRDLNTAQRLFWENVQLPYLLSRRRVDLLHIPAFSPPVYKLTKTIVTVHDLIGMLFPNQLGWPSQFYWGKWLPLTIQRADRIIADSEYTKSDILKHIPFPEKHIRVVYPSGHEGFSSNISKVKLDFARNKYGVKKKYFLTVGSMEPRKNLKTSIEAFLKFKSLLKGEDYELVLVGGQAFAHGQFYKQFLAPIIQNHKDIICTGYVDHDILNALYSGAEAFIFPSLYEGFGVPILEAMASGTAIIASNITSIPEVAGDAARYVNPHDGSDIATAMLAIVRENGLRQALIEKGKEQMKKFSWNRTACETLKVYHELLS